MRKTAVRAAIVLPLLVWTTPPAAAQSVWVTTFDQEFHNWAVAHEATFELPPLAEEYSQVLLHYLLECPPAADCDPWDRLGYLRLLHEERGMTTITPIELARIVTPYDITFGGGPGSCSWVFDVTDYRFLLHDEVTLSNFIETWIGDDRGWLATIQFEFVPGPPPVVEAYRVENLWTFNHLVFGNPGDPVEDHLAPALVTLDPETVAAKIRAVTTGHGQGNTLNAAEFAPMTHTVAAGGVTFDHQLWRNDCEFNLCSPQLGSWQFDRAGWCPGDQVTPWDVDVSHLATPGATLELDYDIQAYENFCRPDNPMCTSGVTCSDCEYNNNGHTRPIYNLNTQLILYRVRPELFIDGFESGDTSAWD